MLCSPVLTFSVENGKQDGSSHGTTWHLKIAILHCRSREIHRGFLQIREGWREELCDGSHGCARILHPKGTPPPSTTRVWLLPTSPSVETLIWPQQHKASRSKPVLAVDLVAL